jgi:1-acyl-sn-glycerol-3-phosphate acyltransferase
VPAVLYLRSFLFLLWFILTTVVTHIVFLPALLMNWRAATLAARAWSNAVLWGLRVFARLGYELRGNAAAARGPVLVAAKHYSMWETIVMMTILPEPAIVMKATLFRVPLYGWYSRKAQMIPVDRHGRASALKKMVADAKRALAHGRPIVIFPEGTRKSPGDAPDYKPGVAALYAQLGVACVPVALNSGLYWTAGGLLKRPGKIVVEFLDPIPPGLKAREFMPALQERIETASARLVAEGRAALKK